MAHPDDHVLFSIGEVAALVGLSRPAIRAWERRHEVEPLRTAGGQRRYTLDDVALLMRVKRTVARRRPPPEPGTGQAPVRSHLPDVQETPPAGLWRRAVDLLPEMLIIVDVDGYVVAANRTAATVLGLRADELTGRHLADLLEAHSPTADVRRLLMRACVHRTRFELDLSAVSPGCRWTFDCRPFSFEGEPHLAVIASPSADRQSIERSSTPGAVSGRPPIVRPESGGRDVQQTAVERTAAKTLSGTLSGAASSRRGRWRPGFSGSV